MTTTTTEPNPSGGADAAPLIIAEATAVRPAVTAMAMTPAAAAILAPLFAAITPWSRYPVPADALARYLEANEPGAPRYALHLGADLVGAFGVRDNWLRGPYLQFLGLAPAYQAHGIGAAVLAALDRRARDLGQRNVWVATSDFNAAALRFYTRHGFEVVAPLADLLADGHAELLLRKRL